MENKYLVVEGELSTTDGFWYDISDGGYIKPHQVLVDQDRAEKLQQAIDLLIDWKEELIDDNILVEL